MQKLEFPPVPENFVFIAPSQFQLLPQAELFRRFSHPKAADTPAARILRLIQSQLVARVVLARA